MRTVDKPRSGFCVFAILLFATATQLYAESTNSFTVAAYNVENWVLMERYGKPDLPKPVPEKQAVWQVVATVQPDVLGVEEMGGTNELAELIEGLRGRGLEYPYREWIQGDDHVRHVALLSRFPITERHSRNDYTYPMDGKQMLIQRGILDVRVQVNDHYSFRAVLVHLKSKRQSDLGDQSVMRVEEAKLLSSHVSRLLQKDARLNLLVFGDLNDTPESDAISDVVGSGAYQLFDLMPVDSQGGYNTHFRHWPKMQSRIDYLLASPGMSNDYVAGSAHIADVPGWDKASDHRLVYAQFYDHDIGGPANVAAAGASGAADRTHSKPVVWVALVVVAVLVTGSVIYRRSRAPSA